MQRRKLSGRNATSLVGGSAAIARVREEVTQQLRRDGPVLIRGEPGTGKSLVAGLVASGKTIVVQCDRSPVEDVRRALLDAGAGRVTLLLEELGDSGPELQKLLEGLELSPGVRLVATTSRNVEQLVRSGSLGEDARHLLGAPTIWLPPLRARRTDVGALARHFLEALPHRHLDAAAVALLEKQSWPRNVTQLREAIRRLALLFDRITAARVKRELETMRAEA